MTSASHESVIVSTDKGRATRVSVSVIMTVRNALDDCAATLESLARQTRCPDEIVIVDGGSTDGTLARLHEFAAVHGRCTIVEATGANIAKGRNIATREATSEVIAATDSGCRLDPDWLAELIRPFEECAKTEVVAGAYRVDSRSLLEEVVGFATMRGQLEPFDAERFNPSGRSIAYRKSLWERAGGWPEWVRFSEDTLFDHKLRRLGATWRFAAGAIAHWRPRGSLRAVARQFYLYGTGRGHTQIDAASFRYNLRNVAILAALCLSGIALPWLWAMGAAWVVYCYVLPFHRRAARIARATGRWSAYPLTFVVMWIVLFSNLLGFIVGTVQRRWRRDSIAIPLERYMSVDTGRGESSGTLHAIPH